jgi:hypothetical protein
LLLAAGANHTCASTADGALECWGAGVQGELGDGAFRDRGQAVRVLYVRDPVLLATGAAHTCAQDARDRLYCWGRAVLPEHVDTSFPVRIEHGPFVALAARDDLTCGLEPAGAIDCWGEGDARRVEAPAKLEPGDRLCARDLCFAIDEQRAAHPVAPKAEDRLSPPPDLGPIQARVTGRAHACARTANGVRCWGDDRRGQLNRGTILLRPQRWEPVPGLTDAVDLAAGTSQVCAVRSAGSVVCWGTELDDESGEETVTLQTVPVTGIDAAVAIAGDQSSGTMCAVLRDGGAVCWQPDLAGEGAEPPVRVAGLTGAASIGVGDGLACAATRSGQVRCWVPHDPDAAARRVPGLPALRDVQVAGFRGCGIDRAQRLWCWDGADGRAEQPRFARRTCRGGPRYLGEHDGAVEDACTQAREAPLTGVRGLVLSGMTESMSLFHALVGKSAVFAYTDTDTGGSMLMPLWKRGPVAPRPTLHDYVEPFPVPPGTERLVGDASSGCAITTAGAVHCWGEPFGQVPVPTALQPPSAVASTHDVMCAQVEGGHVRCQLIVHPDY